MAEYKVRDEHPVLRVVLELVVHLRRVEIHQGSHSPIFFLGAPPETSEVARTVIAVAERQFRIMAVKYPTSAIDAVETLRAVVSVAKHCDIVGMESICRAILVVGEVDGKHVHGKVRRIEVDWIVRVARTVGVEPHYLVVVGGVCAGISLVDGDVPEIGPCRLIAVHDAGLVVDHAAGVRRAHHVPVFVVAAEVVFAEVPVGALLRLVQTPVRAVDEEVVVAAAVVRLPHVALAVAGEHVLDKRKVATAAKFPRVVLCGAEVYLVEGTHALVAKQLVFKFVFAVVAAEEKAQGVLAASALAAHAAAYAEAGRNGDAGGRGVCGGEHLEHNVPLP